MEVLNIITRKLLKNYKAKPLNSIINLVIILILLVITSKVGNWIILEANWLVITKNLHLYFFGSYPKSELWRPLVWISVLAILTLITIVNVNRKLLSKFITSLWLIIIPIGIYLLGGGFGLEPVASRSWGGLTLTLILTGMSSIIALPLGIVLALCRISNIKIINTVSRLYINSMRSFPLIAVLFFGQLLIPLFLPMNYEINRVFRAILAFGLFTSAYVAEDIRGGLQSIPKTQKEAAEALGFSQLKIYQLIILPQAIRIAIPALTNQAIGLLQNTSLMAILGLVELLGISRSLLANPEFIGYYLEVYIWLALLYWLVCTSIALISRRLEKSLQPISSKD